MFGELQEQARSVLTQPRRSKNPLLLHPIKELCQVIEKVKYKPKTDRCDVIQQLQQKETCLDSRSLFSEKKSIQDTHEYEAENQNFTEVENTENINENAHNQSDPIYVPQFSSVDATDTADSSSIKMSDNFEVPLVSDEKEAYGSYSINKSFSFDSDLSDSYESSEGDDIERIILQAEEEEASSIPPHDIREASVSSQFNNVDNYSEHNIIPIVIFRYDKDDLKICNKCKLIKKVKFYYSTMDEEIRYLCDDDCLGNFKSSQNDKVVLNWEDGSLRVKDFSEVSKNPPSLSFIRKCAACNKETNDINQNLIWEIMDFCNELCLKKYQKDTGSHCSSCKKEVKSKSLGKYCERLGNGTKQFCTTGCLEKYKRGLKVCSYCQQDMSGSGTGFLAQVGDKGQFKDFCSQTCMEKYDVMTKDRPPKVVPGTICSVCKTEKPISIEFILGRTTNYFCGEPCFVAFRFVKNISAGKCAMCQRHFLQSTLEKYTMFYDNKQHSFCSTSCENIYIIAHRKIVPCSWCNVKKYNFDMIRSYSKTEPMINMCSVNCLNFYKLSKDANNSRNGCNFCQKMIHPMYHLSMSDSSVRNFCSYNCVINFQNQFPKQMIAANNREQYPVPIGVPRKNKKYAVADSAVFSNTPSIPMITNESLGKANGSVVNNPTIPPCLTPINTRSTRSKSSSVGSSVINSTPQVINSFSEIPFQVQIKQHFIVRPAPLPEQRNIGTMCYTRKLNKGITTKPSLVDQEIQTDEREAKKILIPVPVPIYVPTPMHMYSTPTPVPVPIPIPIPIPIFIPTTKNSVARIMKENKKIQVMPANPYEAELLMMAEIISEKKKVEIKYSNSDVDNTGGLENSYSPKPVVASDTFGDDVLELAFKMATELDESSVDLRELMANTITATQDSEQHYFEDDNVDDPQPMHHHLMDRSPFPTGRKRGMPQSRDGAKRGRRMSHHQVDMPMMQRHQVKQAPPPPEPAEMPDANMCLKYTFGVNAWKQWVTNKNAELEKKRFVKLFKTEILELTADELNFSLCLFVREVRKPNGAEYAPDTIYYLCLGIQHYLLNNGRVDNIFFDPYYEKFTDCLNEVAKKFFLLYNDSNFIVTRVEEEHLWESKQLGAYSPYVLLSTLMFFKTKYFNLKSVDEHMQLSFSRVMKHWKRKPKQPGASKVLASRNVVLRFYPTQSVIQNNTRKKNIYEQQENKKNPLRCPIKLYEFYLSKCPQSVKTRNDVFYLQPERSCAPDSPVWYSTVPLPREALEKMLYRVKMIKEINITLLSS